MLTYADVCSAHQLDAAGLFVIGSRFALYIRAAYVSIRQHTSAYVSIRMLCDRIQVRALYTRSIRQHTPAYASIRKLCDRIQVRALYTAFIPHRPLNTASIPPSYRLSPLIAPQYRLHTAFIPHRPLNTASIPPSYRFSPSIPPQYRLHTASAP
jgi:hypothetical protein